MGRVKKRRDESRRGRQKVSAPQLGSESQNGQSHFDTDTGQKDKQDRIRISWVLDGCGDGGLAFKLAPANQAAAHSEEEALGEDIEHDLAVINSLKEKKAKVPRRQTFERIG